MISIILTKELRAILQSPKFVATFTVYSVLIILGTFIGIREYKAAVSQYEMAKSLNIEEASGKRNWNDVVNRVYREPDPLQIYVSGVHFDVGRFAAVNATARPSLTSSHYSEEPIYAVFRFVDFSFIVLVVLSLMAILFTYDAISGEREQGTLKLIFSNGVPKSSYLLAKALGTLLALVVPLLIPILVSLLMLQLSGVLLSGDQWVRMAIMFGASLLYFVCFISIGLLVSALTRQANVSFLVLLMVWIVVVLIVPRLSILVANQIVTVPTVAEVESIRDGFSKEQWAAESQLIQTRWTNRMSELNGFPPEQREEERQSREWAWMEQDDSSRAAVTSRIEEYTRNLYQDVNNRRARQASTALLMSRLSPASSYQLAAMAAAGTDPEMKMRYESELDSYRERYASFVGEQGKNSGLGIPTRFMIGVGGTTSFNLNAAMNQNELEVSSIPIFSYRDSDVNTLVNKVMPDFLVMIIVASLAFLGAFFAFVRYDVR
jgi:ABC-type transport system involved in multi-copper enzyme maturation permease subunit